MTTRVSRPRRLGLDPSQRRWVVRNALIATAGISAAVSAAIAWLSVLGHSRIPLWSTPVAGGPSTATTALATLLILPTVTSVLCTSAVWRELRRGTLPPLRGVGLRDPC